MTAATQTPRSAPPAHWVQEQLERLWPKRGGVDLKSFHSLMEALPAPMLVVREQDDVLIYANAEAETLFQARRWDYVGHPLPRFWGHAALRDRLLADVRRAGSVHDREARLRCKDGRVLWVLLSVARTMHHGQGVLIYTLKDISAIKTREATLRNQASTDALTGVPNRRHFLDCAQRTLERARQLGDGFTLLALDLDGLKSVNDRHGHACGDALLRSFAQTCLRQLRHTDLFGRIGGDEFAVLLHDTLGEQALELTQRLRWAVQSSVNAGSVNPVRATTSIGLAAFDVRAEPELPLQTLLDRADHALYRAKQAGRNCVMTWECGGVIGAKADGVPLPSSDVRAGRGQTQ